jgi:threonine/homoserine/homoserine lactone efflux protein
MGTATDLTSVISSGLTSLKDGIVNVFSTALPIIVGIFLVILGVAAVFGVSQLAMKLVKRGAGGK